MTARPLRLADGTDHARSPTEKRRRLTIVVSIVGVQLTTLCVLLPTLLALRKIGKLFLRQHAAFAPPTQLVLAVGQHFEWLAVVTVVIADVIPVVLYWRRTRGAAPFVARMGWLSLAHLAGAFGFFVWIVGATMTTGDCFAK